MSFDPHQALRRLIARQDLERGETKDLFSSLMDGELSEPMKAALLVALAMKRESSSEISGAAIAMRERVIPIPHRRDKVVDTCGTGGDGKGTFNISTAAALVAAAVGVPVAKHGNRSVSSRSGSADVLAALGVKIEVPPEVAGRELDELGIAFLFAPLLHPAMREVMPVRKELAVRTIFNLLGPLTNPAGAKRQLIGVFAADLVEIIGRVLADLGAQRAWVVHGNDGLDEITLSATTRVAEVDGGDVRVFTLDPEELGFERCALADLAGGEPVDNAAALRRVFEGEPGPLTEVTVLNAGAAVYVGDRAESLEEGISLAREAIRSGAAAEKLEALARMSQEAGER